MLALVNRVKSATYMSDEQLYVIQSPGTWPGLEVGKQNTGNALGMLSYVAALWWSLLYYQLVKAETTIYE